MRYSLALLMMLHAIGHLPGFLVPWGLVRPEAVPATTTVLNGRVEIGRWGKRAVGLLWLLTGFAFLTATAGAVRDRAWWTGFALTVATISLILSLVEWPLSRVGVLVNVALIGTLIFLLAA